MLTADERDALESAAVLEDPVVCAAFAVAVNSQDLNYLSALFRDIATQRLNEPEVIIDDSIHSCTHFYRGHNMPFCASISLSFSFCLFCYEL